MFKPFSSLKPTTMVVCMSVSSTINLGCLFNLLPIANINPDDYPRAGKNKLPIVPVPGTIISAKFMGIARGIIVSPGCFKNAITITMSSGTKNVCVKLYKDVIHICGIDSNEMIPVISDIIMNMIHNARRMSIYCHEHNTEIDLLKGLGTGSIIIRGGKSVKISNLDPEVVSIIRYMKLAIPPEEFGSFIDWLVQGPFICDENLRILCAEKAMVNYNYNIGFRIIKPNVEEYLDGVDDFLCRYDPNSCFVTVSLPYTAEFKVIKKKKRTYHTFMLYNTGEVTQSGPNEELMAVAYEKFMHLVLRMRDKIMSGDKFTIPIPKYINSLSSPEDHESPKEGIEFDNEEF